MDKSEASTSTAKRGHEDDQGGQAKRHAGADRFRMEIRNTRPNKKPKKAEGGNRIQLTANYFRLPKLPTWSIYKYHGTFEPECLNARLRNALIAKHKDRIGGFLFDGTQLFVTKELPHDLLKLKSTTRENQEYEITLRFTRIVTTNEPEYLQILNLILRRATQGLNLKLINRNFYDPVAKIDLAQFKIQLWPGYNTSIRKHEDDILVNCDVIHKVMRTDTVYDLMTEIHRTDRNNFENNFKQKVLGMTVLTAYNNSTYRVDDVDFNLSPMTTFDRKGNAVTIKDYYAEKYQIQIKDCKQPLLITKPNEKNLRGGQDKPTWLVPELCRITGLSEQQRSNIALKNAMKPYSQMVPNTRISRILDYNRRIQTTNNSIEVIREWNLGLDRDLVRIDGRRINAETLFFGQRREHVVVNASWDRECGRGLRLFQPTELKKWYVVFPQQMERDINKFVLRMIEISRNMGFEVKQPRFRPVPNDRALATEVDALYNTNPQMIFFAVASNKNSNGDIYSAIKKRCLCDYPVPSQVTTRFILSKDKGYDSVVTKIAIQMCSKLGGAPWSVKVPLGGVMTIGFDVSKDSKNKGTSYGCLVATMDLRESADYFATVATYSNTETLSKEFGIGALKAVQKFYTKHQSLPKKIFVYRGGVGDGDIPYLIDIEVKQLEAKLNEFYKQHNCLLEMAFIVVNKKINTRIFENGRNPSTGTVVDDVITMNERLEFYLVSVSSTQGTVTPTHYNVIHDTTADNITIDRIQMWTYKQTHLYYNWCGTTKVPSVLQYATKLCFLISNYVHRVPRNELENQLYFL